MNQLFFVSLSLILVLLRTFPLTIQTCLNCQNNFDTSGSRLSYNRRVQVLLEQDRIRRGSFNILIEFNLGFVSCLLPFEEDFISAIVAAIEVV